MAAATTVRLYSVPWTRGGVNQPFLTSGQLSVFLDSCPKSSPLSALTMAKNGSIDIASGISYMSIITKYNYLTIIQNGITIYCFIDDATAVSVNTTRIQYTIDNVATFLTGATLGRGYIDRISPSGSIVSKQLGDMSPAGWNLRDFLEISTEGDWSVVFYDNASFNPSLFDAGYIYSAQSVGTRVYVARTFAEITALIKSYDGDFTSVAAAYYVPSFMTNASAGLTLADEEKTVLSTPYIRHFISGTTGVSTVPKTYATFSPASLLPSDNTLYHSPYMYWRFVMGTNAVKVSPEDIDTTYSVYVSGGLSPAPYLVMSIPYSRTDAARDPRRYITEDDFPVVQITSDYFSVWQNKKGAQAGISAAMGLTGAIVGGLTGGVGVGIMAAASVASNAASAVIGASATPDTTSGGTTSPIMAAGYWCARVELYEPVPSETTRITTNINAFGYPVKCVANPVISRTGKDYTYIQMSEPLIIADMPESARAELISMFSKGVRLWSVMTNFGRL